MILCLKVASRIQGDQIGLIFAFLVTVYFGLLFENYGSSPTYSATYYHNKSYVLISAKNGLGCILGYFSQSHLVTMLYMQRYWCVAKTWVCMFKDSDSDLGGAVTFVGRKLFHNFLRNFFAKIKQLQRLGTFFPFAKTQKVFFDE
jgi:hypothetical protein